MTGVIWSEKSLRDLRRIDHWLTENAGRDVAIRALAAIRNRVVCLTEFPRIGRPVPENRTRALRATGTPYLVLYQSNNDRIDILRIRHEREDWQVST